MRRGFESLQAHHNGFLIIGPLAQLVEHLTLNQGVTGSIPVRLTISARVAELADALDLGSSGVTPIGVQVPSLAPEKIQIFKVKFKTKQKKTCWMYVFRDCAPGMGSN